MPCPATLFLERRRLGVNGLRSAHNGLLSGSLGHYDKCVFALREENKSDMNTVLNYIFSHAQVTKKNLLVTMLIVSLVLQGTVTMFFSWTYFVTLFVIKGQRIYIGVMLLNGGGGVVPTGPFPQVSYVCCFCSGCKHRIGSDSGQHGIWAGLLDPPPPMQHEVCSIWNAQWHPSILLARVEMLPCIHGLGRDINLGSFSSQSRFPRRPDKWLWKVR